MERQTLRDFLIQRRLSLSLPAYSDLNAVVNNIIKSHFGFVRNTNIGLYWPFRNEFDSREALFRLHEAGNTVSLPRVDKKGHPLVFMRWSPGVRMKEGKLGIPFPLGPIESPEILFIPLVGFDDRGYRLGYGGGYYDITLNSANPMPIRIGCGFEISHVKSIHPQPHDIPMELIITEKGIRHFTPGKVEIVESAARLQEILLDLIFFRFQRWLTRPNFSPVCYSDETNSFNLI